MDESQFIQAKYEAKPQSCPCLKTICYNETAPLQKPNDRRHRIIISIMTTNTTSEYYAHTTHFPFTPPNIDCLCSSLLRVHHDLHSKVFKASTLATLSWLPANLTWDNYPTSRILEETPRVLPRLPASSYMHHTHLLQSSLN
ncbi:hypothetical protein FPOAC2_04647 [Fusarium poae]